MDIPCVGAIVFDEHGRLLLIRRAHAPAAGLWSIPGGRVEPGEDAVAATVREVREETGLDVRVVREVGSVVRELPDGDRYVIRDFLAECAAGVAPRAGDDASDAAFVHPADLGGYALSPGLLEALVGWGLLPADVGPSA